MGFGQKIKEGRALAKSYDFVIKETMQVTGCDRQTAINRFKLLQKSQLQQKHKDNDEAFKFITDKYMSGEVSNDEELAELIINQSIINIMKFTNLKSATEHFTTGSGRSCTLESSDGTASNCSSLEEAKAFFKDHPKIKEKEVKEKEPKDPPAGPEKEPAKGKKKTDKPE